MSKELLAQVTKAKNRTASAVSPQQLIGAKIKSFFPNYYFRSVPKLRNGSNDLYD